MITASEARDLVRLHISTLEANELLKNIYENIRVVASNGEESILVDFKFNSMSSCVAHQLARQELLSKQFTLSDSVSTSTNYFKCDKEVIKIKCIKISW